MNATKSNINFIQSLLKELENEAITTRKMLKCVPDDKFDWKPHPKSMTIRSLATHIAELPLWVTMALTTDELDFNANPYKQVPLNSTEELLAYFEKCLVDGRKHLAETNETVLQQNWTLRSGDVIHTVSTKAEVVRMTYCQIVHHRAQLGVFLRLLDIPIPGSYGPSADEMNL